MRTTNSPSRSPTRTCFATAVVPEEDAEPGKILHETRNGEMAALKEMPFGRYYGSVDATPLFVLLAGAYYERTADRAFAETLWPHVEAALGWIDRYGDRDGDGFVEYQRQSGEGLVHQGWKDSDDAVFHADGSPARGPIALCEVQGYVYAARRAAAALAAVLGLGGRSDALVRQAEVLRERFEQEFWCEELSTYALALDGDKRPCGAAASRMSSKNGTASRRWRRPPLRAMLAPGRFALRFTSAVICWTVGVPLFVEDLAMTNMLLTLAVLLPAAPAPAPKDTMPKGPAPHVVTLRAVSDDKLQFVQTKQEMVQQQVTEQVTEYVQDGQRKVPVARQVTRTIMVPVPVHQLVSVSLDDKGVRVYDADGKKIDSKDVPKLVKKPVAALLSTDGKPVDPFYLRLAREGTLVLVVPKAVLLRQDFSDPDRPKDAGPKPRPVEEPKPLPVKPAPVRER